MAENSNDLPLMANTTESLIRHFLLDLKCDLASKYFTGTITLFLEHIQDAGQSMRVFSIQEYQKSQASNYEKWTKGASGVPSMTGPDASPSLSSPTACPSSEETTISPASLPDETSQGSDICDNYLIEKCKTGMVDARSSLSNKAMNKNSEDSDVFALVLDCCDLEVEKVEAIEINSSLQEEICSGLNDNNHGIFNSVRKEKGTPIDFSVEKWCLKISQCGTRYPWEFPRVVRIHYRTKPGGASLRWALDQDNRECVYSAGMWVNNRALMPCQEFGSLSTWQAYIHVVDSLVVLLTGDSPGKENITSFGMKESYHYSTIPLPSFTLAIAIGFWNCHELRYPYDSQETPSQLCDGTCLHDPPCKVTFSLKKILPCRVFAPESMLNRVVQEIRNYIPKATEAVQELLGPSPFPRIDLLIYPPCSQDMVMSNPNLIFLSQSMFPGDGSMLIKLGHEISHYWWGLLLGARDWTEEWLSEGFATYTEDSIHSKVMAWNEKEYRECSELRALLRYRSLSAEVEHTHEGLQTLRPNYGVPQEDQHSSGETMVVKDGMNPNKLFTQVHYLKGYFLLRHLSEIVGTERFNKMLKKYVIKYHGDMVTSQDFLKTFFKEFPEQRNEAFNIQTVYRDWLDCPGLPKNLSTFDTTFAENCLHRQVLNEISKWDNLMRVRKKTRKRSKRLKFDCEAFLEMGPDQLVLLLEELLNHDEVLNGTVLESIFGIYRIADMNADVRHRWCELVIKHRFTKHYDDLRIFLLQDQAMGVYLYGEMIISQCKRQREIAETCFKEAAPQMESGTKAMISRMIYGD